MRYLKKLINDYFALIPLILLIIWALHVSALNNYPSKAPDRFTPIKITKAYEITGASIIIQYRPKYELIIEETIIETDPTEFDLLCRCVEAEAGNQDFYGKQLVTDVILNRVDDESYPDTITKVILQPGQFSVVKNGTINAIPSKETIEAVNAELKCRQNYEIIFFNNQGFTKYGEKWDKIGDHYFSTKKIF